jgi:hypothetical protein
MSLGRRPTVAPIADVGGFSPTIEPRKGRRRVLLATDYPFLNILWTMIIFFAWVIFIWVAITVLIDVFRRHDVGGWTKAAWVILVIVLPFLGVLLYLLFNHDGMAQRSAKEAKEQKAQFDEYVRETAGGSAGEIAKAKELLDSGAISQDEFDQIKRKALA